MSQPTHQTSSRELRYRVPVGRAQAELVIKHSTFIGTVGPAPDVDSAQTFIADLKARYGDASHNASAFLITSGPQAIIGSSDDGEPGGTAGRPMLAVLAGSGLCQVVAVVTRYFGGTKLGTGGLVRAYGAAVRQALEELATEERVLHYVAHIVVDYALYARLEYLLPQHQVTILGKEFQDAVALDIAVPYDVSQTVHDLLRELSNGQIVIEQNFERYL